MTAKIDHALQKRLVRLMDALDSARKPIDVRIPGFDFHPLKGFNPTRYSVHVNGTWCLTFEFEGKGATRLELENYH